MEINLRISDDYCQGESSALQPLHDDEFDEELKVKKTSNKVKIAPRSKIS